MLLYCLFYNNYHQLRSICFNNNIIHEKNANILQYLYYELIFKIGLKMFKKKTIPGFNIQRYHQNALIAYEIVNF